MKRNILVSLMIIGAVTALISGATFSAFNDTAEVTSTLTTGTVDVSLADGSDVDAGTFTWNPCTEGAVNLGSLSECLSTVAIYYDGTLSAELLFELTTDNAGCFVVSMDWNDGGPVSAPVNLSLGPVTAEDGVLLVSVELNGALDQDALNLCQDTDLDLTLLVTATEVLPVAP